RRHTRSLRDWSSDVCSSDLSSPGYSLANVGPYGGEPSIVSDSVGQLYDTTPSGGTLTYTSTDRGKTWRPVTTADPNSGDDCLAKIGRASCRERGESSGVAGR